jgi:hypothetical protein
MKAGGVAKMDLVSGLMMISEGVYCFRIAAPEFHVAMLPWVSSMKMA